jgi:hypothetical protein
MSAIQVAKRVVQVSGKEFVVAVLSMRDGEYVTYQQAAEVLGTSTANVRNVISRAGVSATKCGRDELSQLKLVGVVGSKAPTANLLDKEAMRVLVKVINTPMAWAAYTALWGIADQTYKS